MPLTLVLAALVVPVLVVLALRARALRAPATDPTRTWFDFAFTSQLVVLAGWLGWAAALWGAGLDVGAIARASALPAWALAAAAMLALTLPPALMALVVVALGHAVSARLRGDGWSRREIVAQSAWRLAGLLLPLAGLAASIAAAIRGEWRVTASAALAAVVVYLACTRRQVGALGVAPRAVTAGPLRDRVFGLAAAAGVRLRMLYVMPTARGRVANAFAVRGQVVLLTDYLLEHLSRREVDAVLAHELAHLKRGHPRKLGLPGAVVIVVAMFLTGGVDPLLWWPGTIVASMLATLLVMRRFEYTADLGAVQLTRDPEALVSALAALARLNHMPLDWSGWRSALLTHPSVVDRARALTRAAGLDPARIETVLRDGCGDPTHHVLPPAAADKAFSTLHKARSVARLGWSTAAVMALAPVAVTALAAVFAPALPRAALLAIAAATAFALALAIHEWLAPRPYAPVRVALAARLAAEGMDLAGATYVGLSPGDRTRVYEGFSDWDVGFLFVRGDRLCYLGEETRFALCRDQVIAVRLGGRVPGWIAAPRVLIDWRGGTLSLRPADVARVSAGRDVAWRLLGVLGAWHDGLADERPASADPTFDALGLPPDGEITAVDPRHIARPATLLPVGVMMALLAAVGCALLGRPLDPSRGPGFVDAWLAAMTAAVALRLPWWTWHERRAAPAAAHEREEHRRAA